MEQWSTDGHGDTWGCVVVCWTMLGSGSASHHTEYMRGVSGIVTQVGHRTVQDGIAVAEGIQWCTGVGHSVQWHVQEY